MSSDSIINIAFGRLAFEPESRGLPDDALLGVVADLSLTIRGEKWFHQPMFPVVELAAAVASWLEQGGDFLFDTMEAEESPFLAIREVPGGCLPEAAWQLFAVQGALPLDTVRGALALFASDVVVATKEQLEIDVREFVGGKAG